MYIHMTTKCNMSCEHCVFDYGNGKRGTNMDIQTFSMALKMARNYDMQITLGGGELTLHKSYKKFVTMAIDSTRENGGGGLFIVTNGSNKIPALWLLETMENEKDMANENFNVELSIDEFHDTYKIDPTVSNWFRRLNKIRTVTKHNSLINAGRATNLGNSYNLRNDCPCSDLQILVDGTIKWCGCKDSQIIGNINFDQNLPENWNGDCHKYKEELIEA